MLSSSYHNDKLEEYDHTTTSLECLRNNLPSIQIFNWLPKEEFIGIIPKSFRYQIHDQNSDFHSNEFSLPDPTDNLSSLLKALYVHSQLGLLSSFHNQYKSMREAVVTANSMVLTSDLNQLVLENGLETVLEDTVAWAST
jgi:hypothetical protein